MDLRSMICFKKVAELQHMTKAAHELYISQAHLSRIISELEDELGVRLFDRAKRGIKLNSCGQIYYQYVLKILNLIEESRRSVQEEQSRKQAQLIVATNAGAYMPGLINLWMHTAPNLRIKQYSVQREQLISMLYEEIISFAIVCPPIEDIRFENTFLRKEPAVIIYPKGHWLEGYKKISIHALKDESFVGVSLGYGARDSVEILYKKYNFSPNFIIETGDTAMVEQYVSAGLGVAVVPLSLIQQEEWFQDHYVEPEEELYGILSLAWNKDRVLSHNDQAFCQTTVEYFKSLAHNPNALKPD